MRKLIPHRRLFHLAVLTLALLVCGLPVAPPASAVTGTIKILAVDGNGAPIKGACFIVSGPSGGLYGCDQHNAGGSAGLDGVTIIEHAPETVQVFEIWTPAGYRRPATASVTIIAGQMTTVTIVHKSGGNTLKLRTITSASQLIGGACYRIIPPRGSHFFGCDWEDGASDGLLRFGGLSEASFGVRQSAAPTGYFPGVFDPHPTRTIAFVVSGTTNTLDWTVKKATRNDTITVSVKNARGNLVLNSAFELSNLAMPNGPTLYRWEGWGGDVIDGRYTFGVIAPGTYQIRVEPWEAALYQLPADKIVTKVAGQALSVTFTLQATT